MVQSVFNDLPNCRRGQPLKLDRAQRESLTKAIGELYEKGYEVVENYREPDWRTPGKPVTADRFLTRFERGGDRTNLYLKTPGQTVLLSDFHPLVEEAIFALGADPQEGRWALARQVRDLTGEGWSYGKGSPRGVYQRLRDSETSRWPVEMKVTSPEGITFPVRNKAQFKTLVEMSERTLPAYVGAVTGAPAVAAALAGVLENGKLPVDKAFEAVELARKVKGVEPDLAATALANTLARNASFEEAAEVVRSNYSTRGMDPKEALESRSRLMTAVGSANFNMAVYHLGQLHGEVNSALRVLYPYRGSAALSYTSPEATGARQSFLELVEQGWDPADVGKAAAVSQVRGGVEELRSLGQWLPRDQDLLRQTTRLKELRPEGLPVGQAAFVFNSIYQRPDPEVKAELARVAALSPDERARILAPVLLGGQAAVEAQSVGVKEERGWVIVGGVRVPRRQAGQY